MGKEIERKFLVRDQSWRQGAGKGEPYRQGYLSLEKERVVRVRIKGSHGFLTIKGARQDLTALEFEYPVPLRDAEEMLEKLCIPPLISKVRYELVHAGVRWEIDEFHGENAGLIVAEVELDDPQQTVELPPWVGQEVSHDRRYSNASLVQSPYSRWKDFPDR